MIHDASLPGPETVWSEPTTPVALDTARTTALCLELARPEKSCIQRVEQFVRGGTRTYIDLCQAVGRAHCNKIVFHAIAVAQHETRPLIRGSRQAANTESRS